MSNLYCRDSYKFYKKHNICVLCKKEKTYKDYTVCLECKEQNKLRQKNYYLTNKETINKKKKNIQKNRYHENKANGICVKCSKRKAIKNRVLCAICNHKAKKVNNKRYEYEIQNKCVICGNERYKDRTICKKCLEVRQKNINILKERKLNNG